MSQQWKKLKLDPAAMSGSWSWYCSRRNIDTTVEQSKNGHVDIPSPDDVTSNGLGDLPKFELNLDFSALGTSDLKKIQEIIANLLRQNSGLRRLGVTVLGHSSARSIGPLCPVMRTVRKGLQKVPKETKLDKFWLTGVKLQSHVELRHLLRSPILSAEVVLDDIELQDAQLPPSCYEFCRGDHSSSVKRLTIQCRTNTNRFGLRTLKGALNLVATYTQLVFLKLNFGHMQVEVTDCLISLLQHGSIEALLLCSGAILTNEEDNFANALKGNNTLHTLSTNQILSKEIQNRLAEVVAESKHITTLNFPRGKDQEATKKVIHHTYLNRFVHHVQGEQQASDSLCDIAIYVKDSNTRATMTYCLFQKAPRLLLAIVRSGNGKSRSDRTKKVI